jgi:hypothetical protein
MCSPWNKLSNKANVSSLNPFFFARYRFLKWMSKFRIFYETLKIFSDFSRENHGHGGHEHDVRRGVFGGKLSFKNMSAGCRLCTLQENPHFWVQTIKVRPPDGRYICWKIYLCILIWVWLCVRRRILELGVVDSTRCSLIGPSHASASEVKRSQKSRPLIRQQRIAELLIQAVLISSQQNGWSLFSS